MAITRQDMDIGAKRSQRMFYSGIQMFYVEKLT